MSKFFKKLATEIFKSGYKFSDVDNILYSDFIINGIEWNEFELIELKNELIPLYFPDCKIKISSSSWDLGGHIQDLRITEKSKLLDFPYQVKD